MRSIPIKPLEDVAEVTGDYKPLDFVGLDDPEEWSRFSTPLDANTTSTQESMLNHDQWESYLVVEGMHCTSCALNVEKTIKALVGIISADVNATSGRARITWSAADTKPSIWIAAINKAGYRAVPAADALTQQDRRKGQRLMLWCLSVAGVAMLLIMMPMAVSLLSTSMLPASLQLMRWTAWLLTLPVLLFSCLPFFQSALTDIQQRQISMDFPVSLGILIAFVVSTAATIDGEFTS